MIGLIQLLIIVRKWLKKTVIVVVIVVVDFGPIQSGHRRKFITCEMKELVYKNELDQCS